MAILGFPNTVKEKETLNVRYPRLQVSQTHSEGQTSQQRPPSEKIHRLLEQKKSPVFA